MPTQFTLAAIAAHTATQLRGDPTSVITGVNTLQQAQPGELAFLMQAQQLKFLKTTRATAVIVTPEHAATCTNAVLITDNPYLAYAKAAQLFERRAATSTGIHSTAIIGKNCQIDPTASIGAYSILADEVVIGAHVAIGTHCIIGARSTLDARAHMCDRVTLNADVRIGARTLIHSGAIIGSDGFGNANDQGKWVKVPQLGGVQIGADVEIGANTTIDRGTLEDTIIEDGVRLDNQIQIAHNVRIGAHTAIAACTGVAGSTSIGRYCMIGGGVGITGHIQIVDKVIITGMSSITHSIDQAGVYSSTMPAMPQRKWWKTLAHFRKLSDLMRRVQNLENTISS